MDLTMKTSRTMPTMTAMTAVRPACSAPDSPVMVTRPTTDQNVNRSNPLSAPDPSSVGRPSDQAFCIAFVTREA